MCIVAMIAIALAVTLLGDPPLDASIQQHAMSLRDGGTGVVMRALSTVGYLPWFAALVAATCLALAATRQRAAVIRVVVTVVIADVAFTSFKAVFRRARPEHADHVVGGWSMPSGHATMAFALATALLLAVPRLRSLWLAVPILGYAALTAASRVVLGVHYTTDVIAGALLGSACALAVFSFAVRRELARTPAL